MRAGLVGYGYWGRNLLRNLIECSHVGDVWVCDSQPGQMEEARRLYPQVRTAPHWAELLEEGRCDCIVVATPTSEHYRMAKAALLAGKHVLVEKPMVTSLAEAKELAAIAHERHLVLMVDHTFVYNPVVARIKEELSSGACGRVHYVDSTRINLGIYQKDINVLWDLACHDISIVLHLIAEQPSHVRAVGRLNPEWGTEDLAYLFLTYPSGMLVQVSASWASPVKIRRMIIGAEKRMMIFDDIEPANKLVIHDYAAIVPGLNGRSATLTDYRLGDSIMPKFPMQEPLALVVSDFLTSAHEGQKPLADAEAAIRVIQVLESAEKSLREGGNLIALG